MSRHHSEARLDVKVAVHLVSPLLTLRFTTKFRGLHQCRRGYGTKGSSNLNESTATKRAFCACANTFLIWRPGQPRRCSMRPINVLLFGSQLGVATDWLSPLSYLYPKQKSFTKIAVFKIEREDEIRSGWKRTSLIIRHYGYCLEHQQSNIARTSSSWPIYEPRRQVHGRCGDSNIESRFGLLLHQHMRGNSPQASKTEYSTSRFHQVKNIAARKTTNERPPFPYFSFPATVAEPQNCWNLAFSMVGWTPKSIYIASQSLVGRLGGVRRNPARRESTTKEPPTSSCHIWWQPSRRMTSYTLGTG